MAKKKRRKLPADLSKPITLSGQNYLIEMLALRGDPEAKKQVVKRVSQELARKLHLLAECYGIDYDEPAADSMLALCLAVEYVPGFRLQGFKKPGRSRRWTRTARQFLVEEIDEYCKNNDVAPYRACAELVKKGQPYFGIGRDSLYRRYNESRQIEPKKHSA